MTHLAQLRTVTMREDVIHLTGIRKEITQLTELSTATMREFLLIQKSPSMLLDSDTMTGTCGNSD